MYKEDEVKAQIAGLQRKLSQYLSLKTMASHPTAQLDEAVTGVRYELEQALRRLAYVKEMNK
jgi:hypothetical protein